MAAIINTIKGLEHSNQAISKDVQKLEIKLWAKAQRIGLDYGAYARTGGRYLKFTRQVREGWSWLTCLENEES